MAQNTASPDTKEIPLTTFAGLVSYMSPSALPMGASPDCQDADFLPGAVFSRPGFRRVFTGPFGSNHITYGKSYVDPSGVIRNLYLDDAGNLWVENISTSPGTYAGLATVTPGCYAKSVTAFGREYIAISDGQHGQEVPLQYDGTNLDRVTQDGPGTPPQITNLIIPKTAATALVRATNVVTVTTGAAHGLKPGYQALIADVPTNQVGGGISSIVIDNEDFPGVATITTASAHGLVPGTFATISGVQAATLGPTVTTLYRQGFLVTVVTSGPHGLSVGASITIPSCPDATFRGSFLINFVPSPTAFTYLQSDTDATVGSPGSTVVQINWPLPETSTPNYFEILACPTPTTFQVPFNYSDGTWTTGVVSFAWNGTFFVLAVPTTTTFTYTQNGPDATASPSGTSTVTPFGQAAPGQHQMQVLFLTRQGYVTTPSPPVKFIANGGQYLSVSNIPIGPPNVVARILAFTGAEGAYFFYIPVPAQINGQLVSTATQINDNTTTAVTLDFGDNTLFASLGISIPGNNLANLVTIDSALGFGFYGSRLFTYGQRNYINNLLNMGFDGGIVPSSSLPTGWTGSGSVVAGHFGQGVSGASLTQSFYEDAYGAPIGLPNTLYRARAWTTAGATITISSASTGFSVSAAISPGPGGWGETVFAAPMPVTIPTDMVINVASGGIIDDLIIMYNEDPYLNGMYGSYANNPESFDGVTGIIGPEDDTHQVFDLGIIRGNLYLVTQDPAGRLHETSQGLSEPAEWTVNEVAANCGLVSPFALTRSQADDSSAAGGEEWFAWLSSTGFRIFGGEEPTKISQEIQRPIGQTFPGAPADLGALNVSAQVTCWALNDPEQQRVWIGIPAGSATGVTTIWFLCYIGLDSAGAIVGAPPIHKSLSGRLVATDLGRKWAPWIRTMNGAALMYREPGKIVPVFFGGTGRKPGT
jgi:hypothetical protein